jgi:hypothetical protein
VQILSKPLGGRVKLWSINILNVIETGFYGDLPVRYLKTIS